MKPEANKSSVTAEAQRTDRLAAKHGGTKEKILQVAFDLIWDSSYGSVSVDDICKRAGVNKGSFYHFFASKADLAVEAYEEHWKAKRPDIDRIFSPQVPPLERIKSWCQYVYDEQKQKAEQFGHVCGCPYASVGAELATQDERVRAKAEALLHCGRMCFESAISDAIRAGEVTVKDPVQAAQMVYYTCAGMMLEARLQNNYEMLKDMESAIMRILGAKTVTA